MWVISGGYKNFPLTTKYKKIIIKKKERKKERKKEKEKNRTNARIYSYKWDRNWKVKSGCFPIFNDGTFITLTRRSLP